MENKHNADYICSAGRVRERLSDDASRHIFDILLEFQKTGDYTKFQETISNPVLQGSGIDTKLAELQRLRENGVELILWGLGQVGFLLLLLLRQYGLSPDYICDRNITKRNRIGILPHLMLGQEQGIPLITPNELFANHKAAGVIVGSAAFYEEISAELRRAGFTEDRIFNQFAAHVKAYNAISFFDKDFLMPLPNEVYVECGVLDCKTIKSFISFCKEGYKKIYAFEPDASCFSKCEGIIRDENIQRLTLLNKACWSKRGSISFSACGTGGSAILEDGAVQIEAITIDEVVKLDEVTLIRMDIEGAELEALIGAAKTIMRCKPRLAICVYHKPEDIVKIPEYILSLVPDYKLYLRHNSYLMCETVMYFV